MKKKKLKHSVSHCLRKRLTVRQAIRSKVVIGRQQPAITSRGHPIEIGATVTLENRNIWVGVLVVVLGVALLVYSSRGGVETSTDGYELHAVYQGIDGVSVGNNVLLAGIKVGKVTALDYIPEGNRAEITMRVRDDIQLPTDSVAMIISAGMLGGKYIKLEPGGEEENFAPGDYFDYVQDAVIFEELLEKIVLDAEAKRLKAKRNHMAAPQPEQKASPFGSLLK